MMFELITLYSRRGTGHEFSQRALSSALKRSGGDGSAVQQQKCHAMTKVPYNDATICMHAQGHHAFKSALHQS
jgi:hypothetical protein